MPRDSIKKSLEGEPKCKRKEKFGAPVPTITTILGELSISEAAQMEREGRLKLKE